MSRKLTIPRPDRGMVHGSAGHRPCNYQDSGVSNLSIGLIAPVGRSLHLVANLNAIKIENFSPHTCGDMKNVV